MRHTPNPRANNESGKLRQQVSLDYWGLLAPKPLGRGMIPLHPQWPADALRPAGIGGVRGHQAPGGAWGNAAHEE